MQTLEQLSQSLEKQAQDAVMSFWMSHAIDKEYGGYWTSLARDGSRYGDGIKWIIVQCRTIYSLCLAYEWFGDKEYLKEASQGVAFFREHFRDKKHGAWHYAVSRDGAEVVNGTKQPYGLAFASYALANYGRIVGDSDIVQDAADTHDLVMEHCWDKTYGGLANVFGSDWQLENEIKRVDTHMHTMEGVSALYHATGDRRYLERLNQLMDVILGQPGKSGCYDAEHGCTKEHFSADWTENTASTQGLTNLGHVTEAGWFISMVAGYNGDEQRYQLGKGLVDWALRVGWDDARGGLHDYATVDGIVKRDRKIWWNQAELLGALAYLYRQTGEEDYLAKLRKQIAFLDSQMVDHVYGGWYPELEADGSVVCRDGEPYDAKGSPWKSPYHTIQGLWHASLDLKRAAGLLPVASPKDWGDWCL